MSTPEGLILTLDGSTRTCSAALLRPAGGLSVEPHSNACSLAARAGEESPPDKPAWVAEAQRAVVDDKGQAKVLLRLVDDMLVEIGAAPRDLTAIVAGTGPGTFTGVRITVATARGLALALSIPVVGVSTLSALAAGAALRGFAERMDDVRALIPVIDARRQQVFYGIYRPEDIADSGAGCRWLLREEFSVCGRQEFGRMLDEQVEGRVVVVGESKALVDDLPRGSEFIAAGVKAEHLVLGQEAIAGPPGRSPGIPAEEVGTPERVMPIYVRSPDADVHITKMKDPWADGRGRGRKRG